MTAAGRAFAAHHVGAGLIASHFVLTDPQIADHLGPALSAIPYPGSWLPVPYDGPDAAVIARDPGFSEIRVDRGTGRVHVVSLTGQEGFTLAPHPSGLAALADGYRAACEAAVAASDDDLDHIVAGFLDTVRAVDPALAEEDEYWGVLAEELGCGMAGEDEPDVAVQIQGAPGPTVIIGLPAALLQRHLAAEGLDLSSFRESVWFGSLRGSVAQTLADTSSPGAWRTGPAQVLVAGVDTPLAPHDLADFEALRLLVLLDADVPDDLLIPSHVTVETVRGAAPFTRLAELIAEHRAAGSFAPLS